ncbi:hypothetical protein PsAD13_04544 [Pseudovibrio sp. Ad13]|nr:hypothetical protein PsAD13_04544 [Pseudovibrio sp. Ad13]
MCSVHYVLLGTDHEIVLDRRLGNHYLVLGGVLLLSGGAGPAPPFADSLGSVTKRLCHGCCPFISACI